MEEKIITEKDLENLGFTPVVDETAINGTKWLLQVSNHSVNTGEIINRDGTWFDAIGTYGYKKSGKMGVSVLCRGNYVCSSILTIERLKEVYFALTEEELK